MLDASWVFKTQFDALKKMLNGSYKQTLQCTIHSVGLY